MTMKRTCQHLPMLYLWEDSGTSLNTFCFKAYAFLYQHKYPNISTLVMKIIPLRLSKIVIQ